MAEKNNKNTAHRDARVLILVENAKNREWLAEVLSANEFKTTSAANTSDALKVIKQWAADIVLMDLSFAKSKKGKKGVEKAWGAIKRAGHTSVIVLAERNDIDTLSSVITKVADDFILKPVDEVELVGRIQNRLWFGDLYKEIEEDKKKLEGLISITKAASATLDPAEVLEIIAKNIAEITNSLRCSILLVKNEQEGLVLESYQDLTSVKGLKIDLRKYPEVQKVLRTQRPLNLANTAKDPLMNEVKNLVGELKNISTLIVPIVFNDDVLGTLFLRARRKGEKFTRQEVDFCQMVANASYFAIKNASIFDSVKSERERLKKVAITDHLTSLYNQNFFYKRLEEEFNRSVRYSISLSLIMMDIDDFKQVNDTHGHRVGDTVLKEVSGVIKNSVRKIDIVARYGGEEFAIILPHTPLKGAAEEAERLRAFVEKHSYHAEISSGITVSQGVASSGKDNIKNASDLVDAADRALYAAKEGGKNRVETAEE